ncbi:MAG: dihydropteridine reductase [Clostridia bacterium]|nr:dihydropteridine reductase [Clostridia bacterium]
MNTDKTYAEKIASEYAPKETRKVVALKKLDNRAKLPANIFAYTFGILTALLLGVGMCLTMNVIGDGSTAFMVIGVVVGIIGIAGVSVNYPIYKKILNSSKKKYSADILALAKEIAED